MEAGITDHVWTITELLAWHQSVTNCHAYREAWALGLADSDLNHAWVAGIQDTVQVFHPSAGRISRVNDLIRIVLLEQKAPLRQRLRMRAPDISKVDPDRHLNPGLSSLATSNRVATAKLSLMSRLSISAAQRRTADHGPPNCLYIRIA
jgi:hypothetical protein